MTRFAAVVGLSAGFAIFVACNSDTGISAGFPDEAIPDGDGELAEEPIDGDAPIAMCTVNKNPVQPPFETAQFDGSASFDPEGREIIGYEWSLTSAPPGNAEPISSRTGPTTSITPQLAGVYRVELTVQNDLGLRSQEPCVVELSATPDEDLWVEMFWSHSGEDMDLHLLRPGGVLETDGDCYFMNCDGGYGPDWGTTGNTSDDPVLDLDDIGGVGPENINLEDPQPGDFTVVVHDYPGSSRFEATNVTVNVYLGGEQVFTDQRSISGEDSYTNFVRVNPTTGAVAPL